MDMDHLDKMETMTRWQAQPPTTLTPAGVKSP
jgi:hypothetical protein